MAQIAIVGAGFSGAVITHELARSGYECDVFEMRRHVGANCYSERDPQTGILLHAFEPHIFHTNNATVWNFVRRFDESLPFSNRIKALTRGRVSSFLI